MTQSTFLLQYLLGTVQAVDTLHPTTAEIRYEQVLTGIVYDKKLSLQ